MESVHLAILKEDEDVFCLNEKEKKFWDWMVERRGEFALLLEKEKSEKRLGDTLEAKVEIALNGSELPARDRLEDLQEFFVVSAVEIKKEGPAWVFLRKAEGKKCPSGWSCQED